MSAVALLCADHPLPLYDSGRRELQTSTHGGCTVSVEVRGFAVEPSTYYRQAVEELGLEMKPCQYELVLRPTEEDAAALRAYLRRSCAPGETVELWQLWVGPDRAERLPHFRGRLADLDREALEQFDPPQPERPAPWQCRMTIEI